MGNAKGQFKRGSEGIFARRAQQLSKGLNAIAKQGARTAELHARKGLVVNVYGTERGKYRRTRNLLYKVYADGHASRTSIGIQVGDKAEYASNIEYGSGPHELTPQQLNGYLEVLKPGGVLRFGRSGKAYLLPGPYIGPALYYTRLLTTQRVRALMRELWV